MNAWAGVTTQIWGPMPPLMANLPSDEKGNALKLKYCSRPSQVLTELRMVPVRVKRNQTCDMTCFLTKLWISCF